MTAVIEAVVSLEIMKKKLAYQATIIPAIPGRYVGMSSVIGVNIVKRFLGT